MMMHSQTETPPPQISTSVAPGMMSATDRHHVTAAAAAATSARIRHETCVHMHVRQAAALLVQRKQLLTQLQLALIARERT